MTACLSTVKEKEEASSDAAPLDLRLVSWLTHRSMLVFVLHMRKSVPIVTDNTRNG